MLSSALPIKAGTRFQSRMAKHRRPSPARSSAGGVEAEARSAPHDARRRRHAPRSVACVCAGRLAGRSHGRRPRREHCDQPWPSPPSPRCVASALLDRHAGEPLDHVLRRLGGHALDLGQGRVGGGADPRLGRFDLRPDLASLAARIRSSVAVALGSLGGRATFSASRPALVHPGAIGRLGLVGRGPRGLGGGEIVRRCACRAPRPSTGSSAASAGRCRNR